MGASTELHIGLPPLLSQLDASLSRDAVCLELRSSFKKLLEQAAGPLSAIRQEAWTGMVTLVERVLADGAHSPLKLDALLLALSMEWPALLTRLHETLNAAARAQADADVAGGPPEAVAGVSRGASAVELTASVQLLQVCCLLLPVRQDCTTLLLQMLLGQLRGGGASVPALACACLDALLAMQCQSPDGFLAFAAAGGIEQLCTLVKGKGTHDRVRTRAVRTLNLLLTQLAPALLPQDSAATPAATPASAGSAAPQPQGLSEAQAAVWHALAAAREVTGTALGREARAMLLRRLSLTDPGGEGKLEQMAAALSLFVESDD